MRVFCTAGVLILLAAGSALCEEVIGGPCQDDRGWIGSKQMREAERSHDWDRLIDLRKQEVRTGCGIAYRWYELADTLLQAGRPKEALRVLQAMDARGFEINPSREASNFPRIERFLTTPLFEASPLGQKLGKLEAISDERRREFARKLRRLPAKERPPEHYVAKNACPFECCRFGDWSVLATTNLVANPGSERVVGTASKGSRVIALTGEVHLTPAPVQVLTDGLFRKGSIVFVLDKLGEGYANFYANGKIVQAEENYARYCFRPSEACWGETILPAVPEGIWWIKIRLPNGVVGWSSRSNHFGNNDACG
ncbi:MAG: hypothetical protein JO340_11990 [Acidobacteriaceae bacterium]|nr:hypothetical protein [Acidobacteriaceae bacterium]